MEKNFLEIKNEYVRITKDFCILSEDIFKELQEVTEEDELRNILERAISLKKEMSSLSDKIEHENLTIPQRYMIRFACRVYGDGAQLNEFMEISWERLYKKIFGNGEK